MALVCQPSASARTLGEEVAVVYNTRLRESKALAEYYAQKRQVPASQVLGFELPTGEDISRAEFRDAMQRPLYNELQTRKLWRVTSKIISATNNHPGRVEWGVGESKIRYLAICYGVPLRIAEDPNLKEEGTEKLRPEMRRNGAAVDSELVLLPLLDRHLTLAGPLRNPVTGTTNTSLLHPTNGVLLVSRLDGPTPAIARGLVDKALEAEATGLWGRAYFDLRNISEPGLKMGDDWIRGGAEICRRLGFETVLDEGPATFGAGFPMSQIAIYAGWYSEHVCGPFAQRTVEFMPGAFAYHLHSFSASSLRSTNRNWVGPLLGKGVTITMGCVDEPYLPGTPEVAVFLARFIYSGFTFGEAACASQPVLSWQITVVGDPLYRPFGRSAEQLHDELEQNQRPQLQWSYLRLANLNQANGKPLGGVVRLLEDLPLTQRSAVLSEKLGDLYATLGKPASAIHAYHQALKLDPSPQQRIRLRFTLGEKLTAQGLEAEAYENWQNLLAENPDYPDKAVVYRPLLLLAQKLGKTADAEHYEAELNRLTVPARAQ